MNKSGQNSHQAPSGNTSVSIKNMYNRQMNNPQGKAITPKNNVAMVDP